MKNIFEGLNPPQQEAVRTTEGPVLILAGAGSGKTRALTHRLAFLISEKKVSPFNILCVTFTNKAAGEMKARMEILLNQKSKIKNQNDGSHSVAGLSVDSHLHWNDEENSTNYKLPWLGTFHSICVKILRREAQHIGYPSNFTIYDSQDQLSVVKKIMRDQNINPKNYNPNAILSHISGAKNEFLGPKEYSKYANSHFDEIVRDVYAEYQKYLKSIGAMDFDDLLLNCVKLFDDNPTALEKYQRIFKYILVDEYQDTNQVQYLWIRQLSKIHKNLCVVGDDSQSIYGFRGANFRNILNFERDFPQTKVIKLEQNYRSTKNILVGADALIKYNRHKTEKTLWTDNPDGQKIQIYEALNEKDEAEFVAQEITSLAQNQKSKIKNQNDGSHSVARFLDLSTNYKLQTTSFSQFAVLYRTNAQSRAVEEAFLRYEIPYRVVGGIRFYQRREVKDILAYLRLVANPNDRVSFERAINLPPRGIGAKTLEKYFAAENLSVELPEKIAKFLSWINGIRERKDNLSVADMIDIITESSGYKDFILDGTAEGEGRWENILELKTVATYNETADSESPLDDFLEKVALYQDSDEIKSNENVVTLMTLHSAKGLEFPIVFVIGLEEGILPHSRSEFEPDQVEEERRLCYVGMTRAQKTLYLLYAGERTYFGKLTMNLPSRFLEEIPEEVKEEI
ncbi:MAG: UvrD-helicase domain-containing protein [Candidatus Berkelbacteria bacterium]|nr:UvrD-helicase domain-containing protein [Candidatus Berkelbacteria bacterium]